ncbi:MAG: DUF349 domain-containing protein [Propionibacteriaceae bacterium]|jgi:hypothetical protein|nr:DUF349 domain-containing protein [Propionibacteriaceae bacterium]
MSESTGSTSFGRVEADGTVYVTTSDGERKVGQVPDVSESEALAFYVRRFEALAAQADLLSQRIHSGAVSPEEAKKLVAALKAEVTGANAVGDLEALAAQLEELNPVIASQLEARKAERAEKQAEAKAAKEKMVAEAEKLAAGNDWKGGVNRFRTLLDAWKVLPRIDRATDDELWHRFSSARTTYTRRRKAQFEQWAELHGAAEAAKKQLIAEAEELAVSTDWGNTANAFRDLMTRWKAAGSAGKEADDKLWHRFRGLQEQFFTARSAVFTARDNEFESNLTIKEELLASAEAEILPVRDLSAARVALRSFLARYNEIGQVPRSAIGKLDARIRALDSAIKAAEEKEWRRSDPEAQERAADTVAMFDTQLEKLAKQLEAATAKNDAKLIAKLTDSITTYTAWRDQAASTLAEYTA